MNGRNGLVARPGQCAVIRFRSTRLTFILGPNGAGKTVLLKALLNLIPYSGEVC
jgi:ABC-type Mn2+/Zn2+ transport system ATPase subunit